MSTADNPDVDGLLHGSHLLDLIKIVDNANSVNEPHVIDALVDISAELYAARLTEPRTPSKGDRDLIARLVAVLASNSRELGERFAGPTVRLVSEVSEFNQRLSQLQSWKPERVVWTAPVSGDGSAWERWANRTGNARPWSATIQYDTPPPHQRLILTSLEVADELADNQAIGDVLAQMQHSGLVRIDFSWRCVLEAECSVLLGERNSGSFPSDLGTESCLWLETPIDSDVKLMSAFTQKSKPDSTHLPGWFIEG